MVPRSEDEQRRIQAAFTRYEAAQLGGDRQELSTSRLRLTQLLEQSGWTVPGEVREQMRRDEKVLRRLAEPDAVIDLLRAPSHRFPVP